MIEHGIHFNLSDDEYHGDAALGSTDIRRVARNPYDYWWFSNMNPVRPSVEATPAMGYGRAVHKVTLEGTTAFHSAYGPCEFPGNIKAGKEERAALGAQGKLPLRRADYDRIMVAGAMIRENPNLSEAFHGGRPEVSVFWERDGVPLKCRFDYLKLRAITDLKSIRNSRGIEFTEACRRRFSDDRQDVQAEHYSEGRRMMKQFVDEGRVFGDHDADWLKRCADQDQFAFVFVYWQAEGAPVSWGFSLSPGNPILEAGRSSIEAALQRYREYKEKFGDTAWVFAEPVEELDIDQLPPWWARAA